MAQPGLGFLASAIVIAIALGFLALFEFPTFAGPVAFYLLCLIPFQIVVVVLWGANLPFTARLAQPARGAALLLLTALVAAVIAPLALQAVGEGVSPPGPIPSHYAVIVVPTAFFLAIAFGGWPFTTLARRPVVSGLLVLAAAYVITFALFRAFFNYDFLQGAPVYLASAPAGAFNGVTALVFYVTALAGMFLVLCFDLWPFTTSPAVMKQPVLGLAWLAVSLAIGALVMWVTTGLLGMDPMIVLVRVTAPFIFGTIIVLNMLGNTLFATMSQPVKGVANSVAAAVVGAGLAAVFALAAPALVGPLPSGAPGYEREIWLVNALLSVTFPLLIVHAAYFGFWPLAKPAPAAPAEPVRT